MENKSPAQIQRLLNVKFSFFFFSAILVLLISSLSENYYGPFIDINKNTLDILKYIAIASLLIHLPIAFIIPQNAIKKIDKDLVLNAKMILYYKALFFRFAITASAIISVCLIFVITADTNLIYIAAMGLVFFLISKPSPFKTASDLQLKAEEKKELFKTE